MENLRSFGTWMLAVHVLAALWLAAGVFASSVVFALVKRAKSPTERSFGMHVAARLTNVFVVPGVIAAGLLGFYLVTGRGYGFGLLWVQISMVLYLLLLAGILFYQAPQIRKAAETGGNLSAGAAMMSHLAALIIVVLVVLMALKPAS